MNILYISKLSGARWTGPNNSVPKQIAYQSEIDNVLWYNLASPKRDDWASLPYYLDLNNLPKPRLSVLPEPFNHPDVVVFQGFYSYPFLRIIKELRQKSIPYVIVPRCEFTDKAQSQKRLKKIIGNKVFFNSFARGAAAIHYLTPNELRESRRFNFGNGFIVPNGVELTGERAARQYQKGGGVKGVYIGRVDLFHKGLDILVEACALSAAVLRDKNCTIEIYGPDYGGSARILRGMIDDYQISDLIKICRPVFGEEKERILQSSDFFIMTSRFEGQPMGLIEALAHGLPCIVTQGTNMLNEIVSENAGWGAEGDDALAVSSSIRSLLENLDEIGERSLNAIQLAKRYDWKEIAARLHYVYSELI